MTTTTGEKSTGRLLGDTHIQNFLASVNINEHDKVSNTGQLVHKLDSSKPNTAAFLPLFFERADQCVGKYK